jgi:hypothetical protein
MKFLDSCWDWAAWTHGSGRQTSSLQLLATERELDSIRLEFAGQISTKLDSKKFAKFWWFRHIYNSTFKVKTLPPTNQQSCLGINLLPTQINKVYTVSCIVSWLDPQTPCTKSQHHVLFRNLTGLKPCFAIRTSVRMRSHPFIMSISTKREPLLSLPETKGKQTSLSTNLNGRIIKVWDRDTLTL